MVKETEKRRGANSKLLPFNFNLLQISVDNIEQKYKIIPVESVVPKFNLNYQLKKKWQIALAESIPLFSHNFQFRYTIFAVILEKTFFCFEKKKLNYYVLKLPNFPKNIQEMITIRCWLEHLFNCAFEYAYFDRIVFNPELINLLFDNDKTIPPQFNIQKPFLSLYNNTFEYIFKFVSNHLAISESVSINFSENSITEQNVNILLNILTNEGDKFPQFCLKSDNCFRLIRLYDFIVQVNINYNLQNYW
ncbi:unnamed protein product [Meloidogyne enterolobii]|uniref:Uncharacterized protein n=1 Tax=Meloidogyne enterolobii TaxID=390850 RepID=A0ACB0Y7X1_MELEN